MTNKVAIATAENLWSNLLVDELLDDPISFVSSTGVIQIMLSLPSINSNFGAKLYEIKTINNQLVEVDFKWIPLNRWLLLPPSAQFFEDSTQYKLESNTRFNEIRVSIKTYTLGRSDIFDSLNERLVLIENALGGSTTDYTQALADIQLSLTELTNTHIVQLDQRIDNAKADIQISLINEISNITARLDLIESNINYIIAALQI